MCSNPQRSCWLLVCATEKFNQETIASDSSKVVFPLFIYLFLFIFKKKPQHNAFLAGKETDGIKPASLLLPSLHYRERWRRVQRWDRDWKSCSSFFCFYFVFSFHFYEERTQQPAKRARDVLVFTASRPLAVPPKTFYLLSLPLSFPPSFPSPKAAH